MDSLREGEISMGNHFDVRFYWGTSKSQYFEWGMCGFLVIFSGVIFSYKDSSGVSDFSNGVKKWAIFGNIFHWGDEWGGSHWVTEAGVYVTGGL